MSKLRKVVSKLYNLVGKWYLTPKLRSEWNAQPVGKINERPVEYAFAMKCLSRVCPQEVLDVGPGTSPWPQLMAKCGFKVTAIDEIQGYWAGEFFNRHHYVIHDDITDPKLSHEFDFATCISVIEHIPDHLAAMKGLFKLLKPGGHLVVSFPYNESCFVDNVYALEGAGYGKNAKYICRVYSRSEIDLWLKECGGTIVEQEYYEAFTGDLWTFGQRLYPPREASKDSKHHLTCLLIRKNG